MKLKLFKSPKTETPSAVYLVLWQLDRGVVVRAVDESGAPIPRGYLLEFSDDGTIRLSGGITRSLGFKLDGAGRIMFSDMCD